MMRIDLANSNSLDVIRHTADSWLKEKKSEFSGEMYVIKLRENSSYFFEATAASIHAITMYLREGEPQLTNAADIQAYVNHIGRSEGQRHLPAIHAYINSRTSVYPPNQWSIADWNIFRDSSLYPSYSAYIAKLEYLCRHGQVATILADTYLTRFLGDPHFRGVAFKIPSKELYNICEYRIEMHTSICLHGLMPRT